MTQTRVMLLKGLGWRAADFGSLPQRLPYRVDLLEAMGFDLSVNDALWRWPLATRLGRAVLRRTKPHGVPVVETVSSWPRLRDADVCLAMWETEGAMVSSARASRMATAVPPVVLMSCWLAQAALDASPAELGRLRRRYQAVDRFITFSPNQPGILSERLGIDRSRIEVVDLGVDDEFFFPVDVTTGDFVLAVGRDQQRDWTTALSAIARARVPARIAAPRSMLRGLPAAEHVEMLGLVDRWLYRALLARARLVLVPVGDAAYPSGQSVLLEAMMMGKCCVVTRTAALEGYVEDGRTAVFTEIGDSDGLAETLRQLWEDDHRRELIGAQARQVALDRFRAEQMWRTVAATLRSVTA